MQDGASLPISRLRTRKARGGVAEVGDDGVDLYEARFDGFSLGVDGVDWI